MPLAMAWSTPGAALLVAAGPVSGGYPAAIGAFLLAGPLIVLAGLWRPLTRAIVAIPGPIASGLMAGVLLPICLQPVHAVVDVPKLAIPAVVVWLVLSRVARRWAVPGRWPRRRSRWRSTRLPVPTGHLLPQLTFVTPRFHLGTLLGVGLPLFIVTMVSQNVAGISVLPRTATPRPCARSWS